MRLSGCLNNSQEIILVSISDHAVCRSAGSTMKTMIQGLVGAVFCCIRAGKKATAANSSSAREALATTFYNHKRQLLPVIPPVNLGTRTA